MALSPLGMAMMMQPPAQQPRPGTVNPTDVLGAYNLSASMAEQQYQAKLAQQNAMWGGLAGLGAAGIIAAPKLFGAGGPLAGLIGSEKPIDLGNAIYNNGTPVGITGVGPFAGGPGDVAASGAADATAAVPSWFNAASLSSYGAPAAAPAVASIDAGIPFAAAPFSAGSTIAADTAAAAPVIDAGTAAGADAAGMTLADLFPFFFA